MCQFRRANVAFGAMMALFLFVTAAWSGYALADKNEIEKFFGTDRVKVVFISEKQLYFADFGEAAPQLKVIAGARAPVNPVISPDGKRIAYASGTKLDSDAPATSQSAAWICDIAQDATPALIDSLAYVPRFVQNAPQQTVIFADSGCGDSASMANHPWNGCGRVWKKNIVTNEKTVVWDKGSWYGGLSHDGKWLATAEGLKNAFLINITEPAPVPRVLHTLRLKVAATGKDTLLGFLTCNPSVSSSRIFPDAIMYLDIAVKTTCGTAFTIPGWGEDAGWDNHTRIFIARSNGTISRNYRAPETGGKTSGAAWAYPEWSNHPYFAASALEVNRYWSELDDFFPNNERLYAINLRDSAYLPLVFQMDTSLANLKKQNIKWPWLWVETPDTFAAIEDKSWLDGSPGSIRPAWTAPGPGRVPVIVAKGNLRVVSATITAITFYTLGGAMLKSIAAPREGDVISLGKHAGVIIVRCVEKCRRPSTATMATIR